MRRFNGVFSRGARKLIFAMALGASINAVADQETNMSEGEALFVEKCAMCHRAMGMGTWQLEQRYSKEQAWLENRESLPPAFVKHVVRNGLGIMFSISRAEVSDPQLELIADYLGKEAP